MSIVVHIEGRWPFFASAPVKQHRSLLCHDAFPGNVLIDEFNAVVCPHQLLMFLLSGVADFEFLMDVEILERTPAGTCLTM